MARSNLLIYLLRRDLRVSDNPILHHLATNKDHGFTHLLPVYVFPHHQIEISGFLKEGETSPYPQALSQVAKFWRCGPHRAKFIAEAVWDVKKSLEDLNSGVLLRVGSVQDVLGQLIPALKEQQHDVGAVWMTEEKSYEEKQEQDSAASVCAEAGVAFKLWADTKYFVDE
jgi:deoxyribodipyrimidine photo-lyase